MVIKKEKTNTKGYFEIIYISRRVVFDESSDDGYLEIDMETVSL